MKRRKAVATLLVLIAIATPLSLAFTYLHDNPAGMTPISSINAGITPIGTNVTLKGEIKEIVFLLMGLNDQSVRMSDGSGNISFFWTETRLQVNWIILVKGTIYANHSLHPVSSVEIVSLFP
jgi:DNA/RNA endonuclease YhcR with UshA esterase domain